MKKSLILKLICLIVLFPQILLQYPSVYPTGTTIYNPEKCWNGYTIFPGVESQGAFLIDMNGKVVKHWEEIFGEPIPNRILPGGYVVGSTGRREGIRNLLILYRWIGMGTLYGNSIRSSRLRRKGRNRSGWPGSIMIGRERVIL